MKLSYVMIILNFMEFKCWLSFNYIRLLLICELDRNLVILYGCLFNGESFYGCCLDMRIKDKWEWSVLLEDLKF